MTFPTAVSVETLEVGGDGSGVVCAGVETAEAEVLGTETGAGAAEEEGGGTEMVESDAGVFAIGGA